MRVKVKMKKLTKPEAQFVSLVRRSANQIPFRIQKADGEDTMIDLSSITRMVRSASKVKKTAPTEPKVSAIVVSKTEDFEKVKETISKAGFSLDSPIENADGTVLFAQDDDSPEEDATPVRVGKGVVLVVKGLPLDAVHDYSAQLGAEGYVDDMVNGAMALGPLFAKAVEESEDHESFKDSIRKTMGGFTKFVDGLIDVIPISAYKANSGVELIQKAQEEKAAKIAKGATVDDTKKLETEKKEPEKKEEVVKAEEKKVDAKPDAVGEQLTKLLTSITEMRGAFDKRLEEITSVQKAQSEKIDVAAKTAEELKVQVLAATQKAEETEKVVKGAVLAPAPAGDRPAKTAVKKQEDEMGDGYWDSALASRAARHR